jgi:transposase
MRPSDTLTGVYLCREPVDLRKSIDGLGTLVEAGLERNPFEGALFVFTNRRRDKLKILYWERNGFVLWYKRLERERFKWPKAQEAVVTLTGREQIDDRDAFEAVHGQGVRRPDCHVVEEALSRAFLSMGGMAEESAFADLGLSHFRYRRTPTKGNTRDQDPRPRTAIY